MGAARAKALALAVALALLMGGCAADLSRLKDDSSLPGAARVENLTPFAQDEHQCGAAALATVFLWAGVKGETPQTLAPRIYTPEKKGAFFFDLEREARLRGLLAYRLSGVREILAQSARGRPVIVLENRALGFYPLYHYSVVAGYDLSRETITLLEGEESPADHSLGVFLNTFERSGSLALLALGGGELPADESPSSILEAIKDLEKVAGSPKALPFYKSYAARYPKSWLGRFAHGNALYATGDKKGAQGEFEEAARLDPRRPEPPNNLALLKMEEGLAKEAGELAQRAVKAAREAGMDAAPYEETLRETEGK